MNRPEIWSLNGHPVIFRHPMHSARMTCKPWKKPLSCTAMPLYIWFYGLLIRRVFHFPLFLLVSATWENDLCSWLQYYPHLLSLFFSLFFLPSFLFSLSLSLSLYLSIYLSNHLHMHGSRLVDYRVPVVHWRRSSHRARVLVEHRLSSVPD